jgi:polyphosphate kinase
MKKTSRKSPAKRVARKTKVPEFQTATTAEFANRELGWLEFNRRVLAEAEDTRNPLLERVRFLGICSSNLDEFVMKRLGGLKRQMAYGLVTKSSDGFTAPQQLESIRFHLLPMIKEQAHCFYKTLQPELAKNGIHLVQWGDLNDEEKDHLKQIYQRNIFPILTPLSVDPGHPFPFISNLSTSLGVTLKHPDREENLFARVKVPKVLPQWVRVETKNLNEFKFISLVELIKANLGDLFSQLQVLNIMAFRLTRNADIERDEEDAADLLEMIEEEIRQRRFAEVVRLEHGPNPDPWMLKFLMSELDLKEQDVYELSGELDYTSLNMISDLGFPKLKYTPWVPRVPRSLSDDSADLFSVIKSKDILLHHPYESFSQSVEKFIRLACEDPKVLAIKMTLYRTGDNSPFVKALIRAAEKGKQVVCLIELKARFDEERNIYWAQELEDAGVHVVYGVVGLKTHAKIALIVRNEADGIRSYAHFGTGNYNVQTSRLYSDLGLLTAREDIITELVELFHYLTGRSLKTDYKHLLVAPLNMNSRFLHMIQRESEFAKAGRPAQIIAKFNNMEENQIAKALYLASQAGVDIDLIVRGFCTLRPHVKGLSERIRVTSIIGRFLEHSRIFYFRNGSENPVDGEFFLGSADWMYRNLHARVETVVPIYDRSLKEKCWEILNTMLKDQRQSWDMKADGHYKQRKPTEGSLVGCHELFMNQSLMVSGLAEEG